MLRCCNVVSVADARGGGSRRDIRQHPLRDTVVPVLRRMTAWVGEQAEFDRSFSVEFARPVFGQVRCIRFAWRPEDIDAA